VQFGVVIPSYGSWAKPRRILEAIRAVEDEGYDAAWFGDHIVIPDYAAHMSPPPWLHAVSSMLVGAGCTERIRLGSDVLVLPYRNPVDLSQLIASGDQLSAGRLILGVGVGYIRGEFEAVGAPPYDERGAVTDEFLMAMRSLWESDGPVSFSGKWAGFQDVHAAPAPFQRPFPVWVGGNGPAARRRAASLGNGWHPLFPTPEDYARGREEIQERRRASEQKGAFDFSYSCFATHILMGSEPSPFNGTGSVPARSAPPEYDYAPLPPRDGSGRLYFVGTPSQVLQDIEVHANAGVEHLTMRFWHNDQNFGLEEFRTQLARFGQQVLRVYRQ
jgi:probable F420-dependent oxidoreductase